jgi:hypothetical protein
VGENDPERVPFFDVMTRDYFRCHHVACGVVVYFDLLISLVILDFFLAAAFFLITPFLAVLSKFL